MPRRIFLFDPPDRFVAGTVGEPGHRTFFLQARRGRSLVSVVLEKVQVAALAQRLAELLDELGRRGVDVPDEVSGTTQDGEPLDEPLVEEFRVGTMVLGWDPERKLVVIEARAQTEDDEAEAEEAESDDDEDEDDVDDENGPDTVRVRLEPVATRAFIARAAQLVAAGRPPCPLCGLPLNPEGHICPRRNGRVH